MGDLVGPLVGLVIGALAGFFAERVIRGPAYKSRDEILKQAERDAESVRKTGELQAKEEVLRRREAAEKELNVTREELRNHERHLDKRESTLEEVQEDIAKKERMLESTQQKLTDRTRSIEAKEKELDRVLKQEQEQLYQIAGLDQKTATDMLLSQLERELKSETGALIIKRESELKQQSEKLAREIVGMAIQRYASAHTSETTVSTIDIPSDEMKGRIIGREGRNIRAFEKATGVDVIVDDTPGVVVVSAFDSVRRETARLALTKLIQDGRIHPTRIDEVVAETQKEMDSNIAKVGAEPCRKPASPTCTKRSSS